MAYNTDGLANKRGGAVIEENTGGVSPQAGLYRHPDTGEELVTLEDPLFGNAQSEGVSRVGFVRVGDTPEGYIKAINLQHEESQTVINGKVAASAEDLKGVLARLTAVENENVALRAAAPAEPEVPAEGTDATPADAPAEGEDAPKDPALEGEVENETNETEGA